MTEKIEIPGQDWHIEIAQDNEQAIVLRIVNSGYLSTPFDEEKRKAIKEDILKDWGKWRKYKELKKDLEN